MRWLLIILAAWHAANGLFMLAAPGVWYGAVPGVTETGPANAHFIRDIGLGFLAAAAALALAARRGAAPPDRGPGLAALLAPALVFLVGHAGLHIAEMILHGARLGPALRDLALIVVPALLLLAVYWRLRVGKRKGIQDTTSAGAGL